MQITTKGMEKVVIVMGATGTGKSKLSIDLATQFQAEVINADKIQVYKGLDIVTNKITDEECNGVAHHLLGIVDPESDFTADNFARAALLAMKSIIQRGKMPIIAGGSNSFVEALVDDEKYEFKSRYDVCFLWVDVATVVHNQILAERVDRMVASGMVEEVRNMYNPNADYSKGIRRAIGVPEFDSYFRAEYSSSSDEKARAKLLEAAINETKINTCSLVNRQLEKIYRLTNVKGWKIHRLDATKVFQKKGKEADEAWAELVVGPALVIVSEFLYDQSQDFSDMGAGNLGSDIREVEKGTAVATATY
ncbi:adenylate isopentenyltransferase 3, chloroplastic [Lactuca sativa]|nr:adenylate isopentenyltransferase 3, chloroplastic [Lactuca sativa]